MGLRDRINRAVERHAEKALERRGAEKQVVGGQTYYVIDRSKKKGGTR